MSKQKIILLIFIFILLATVGLFFFFIQKEKNKINNIDNDFLNKETIPFKDHEKVKIELESFREPSRDLVFPYPAPTDESIKNDEEIKQEIDNYNPSSNNNSTPNNPNNLSNEEILQLLKNPELAN